MGLFGWPTSTRGPVSGVLRCAGAVKSQSQLPFSVTVTTRSNGHQSRPGREGSAHASSGAHPVEANIARRRRLARSFEGTVACRPPFLPSGGLKGGTDGHRWLMGGNKGRVGARREGGENCKGDHAQIQMGGRGARRVGRFRGTNAQTSPTRWCLLSSTTGCNQEPGPACPAGKGQSLSAGAGEPGTRTARACWGRPHS